MEKKNIDWENLDFGYRQTDKRFVANYKDGAWDEGTLTEDANIVLNECAGVLQYAQTVFEGLKAYTTVDGKVVIFRPDLNASRMADSARRLEMPVYPEDKFIEAVEKNRKKQTLHMCHIWHRCNTLYPSVYVRKQPCYWCETGTGVSVPCIDNTGRTILQRRSKTVNDPCYRF